MQAKEFVGFMLDEERSERLQLALRNLRLIHIVFEASVSNVDKRDQLSEDRAMPSPQCDRCEGAKHETPCAKVPTRLPSRTPSNPIGEVDVDLD